MEQEAAAKARAAADQAFKRAKDGGKLSGVFPKKPVPSDDAAKSDEEEKSGHDDRVYYQETDLFARSRDVLPGVGISEEATQAAFTQLKPGEIGGPFPLKDSATSFVVVQLLERKEPDWGTFAKTREEIRRRYEIEKGYRVFGDWSQRRCMEAKQAGNILVNQDLFAAGAPENGPQPPPYSPCFSLGLM